MKTFHAMLDPQLQNPNGQQPAVSVTMQFTSGQSETIAFPLAELGEIIAYFAGIAAFAAAHGAMPAPDRQTPIIGPFPTHGAGISLGTPGNDSAILLFLDCPGLRLGFEMTSKQLHEIETALRPILKAAEAPRTNRPN